MANIHEEGGKGILPPPRENFIIAGTPVHIGRYLDSEMYDVDRLYPFLPEKMKPGDFEAFEILRDLSYVGTTSRDYSIAMPRLFEYAAEPDGGFDADFLNVTHYFIKKILSRRGGMTKVILSEAIGDSASDAHIKRIAYLSDVYGHVQAMRDIIWRDPAMEGTKKRAIEIAAIYKKQPWPK